MQPDFYIFDRNLKKKQRERSAKILDRHSFIIEQANLLLNAHLEGLTREFPALLELGARDGRFSKNINNKFGIKNIFAVEISENFIKKNGQKLKLIADEEFLPFAKESFDLIISLLNLHWVNDLPGCLIQIKDSLKKNGLFLASIFGGESLKELRQAIIKTEAELISGSSPRISPFVDIRDAAALMQRAGFSMPVVDAEKITVIYTDTKTLLHDLRGMAENNALIKRNRKYPGKEFFMRLEKNYQEMFGNGNEIPATFEIITLSGSKN